MKRITRITEIWEMRGGGKERITWNPCNCHPNDVMREWSTLKSMKFNKAVCYPGQNKSAFTRSMERRGGIRLSREIVVIK